MSLVILHKEFLQRSSYFLSYLQHYEPTFFQWWIKVSHEMKRLHCLYSETESKKIAGYQHSPLVGYEYLHIDGASLYNCLSLCAGKQRQDRWQQAKCQLAFLYRLLFGEGVVKRPEAPCHHFSLPNPDHSKGLGHSSIGERKNFWMEGKGSLSRRFLLALKFPNTTLSIRQTPGQAFTFLQKSQFSFPSRYH